MPDTAPAAQPGQAQQPPFGASPATGPVPNKGYEAAALQRLGLMTKQLTDLLSMAGASSEVGRDILKVLSILTKHVPAGSVSPAAEKNNIERMAMQNAQNNQQMSALKAQAPAGQPPAAPAQPQAA